MYSYQIKAREDFDNWKKIFAKDVNLNVDRPVLLDNAAYSEFSVFKGGAVSGLLDMLRQKHVIIPASSPASMDFEGALKSTGYSMAHITSIHGV